MEEIETNVRDAIERCLSVDVEQTATCVIPAVLLDQVTENDLPAPGLCWQPLNARQLRHSGSLTKAVNRNFLGAGSA